MVMTTYGPITTENRQIILASGSPRRLELLQRVGLEAIVVKAAVEERRQPGELARDYTRRLAQEKTLEVARLVAESDKLTRFILGADTVVVLDDAVLEKPQSGEEAVQMLQRLSGRSHTVVTSFALLDRNCYQAPAWDGVSGLSVVTREPQVIMRNLSEETIRRYVATGEPMDKAGAYGIQEVGAALVDSVNGSYFAVMGLPIADVIGKLEEIGGVVGHPFGGAGVRERV